MSITNKIFNRKTSSIDEVKVFELVNKYYYDFVSSKIYFKTFKVWEMGKEQKQVFYVLLIHFILILTSILGIIFNSFGITFEKLNFNNIKMCYLWFGYIYSLIVFSCLVVFIEDRIIKILRERFQTKNFAEMQEKWLNNNLPNSINKSKLIKKMQLWFEKNQKIVKQSNDFLFAEQVLQNKKISVAIYSLISVFFMALSSIVFDNNSLQVIASKSPNMAIAIILLILIYIVIALFVFSILSKLFIRFFNFLDGENSKSSRRFNLFYKMLSHNITIKEIMDN